MLQPTAQVASPPGDGVAEPAQGPWAIRHVPTRAQRGELHQGCTWAPSFEENKTNTHTTHKTPESEWEGGLHSESTAEYSIRAGGFVMRKRGASLETHPRSKEKTTSRAALHMGPICQDPEIKQSAP